MYLIELVAKWYSNRKTKKQSYNEEIDYQKCEHIFLALDSDADYVACSKCGFVMQNPQKKNFFMK